MRLFWKLFWLQVLAGAAVIVCALVVSRAYSLSGFAEFLERHERERIEQLAERFEEALENGGELTRAWDSVPALRERRSEERRVGKECRSRWSRYHQKKKRKRRPRSRD